MKRKFEYVRRRNLLGRVNGSFIRRNEPHEAADNSRGEAFRRDTPTLLCYAVLAGFAFWRYAFGLAPALLRAEMHFSYTLVGVYSALWSFGTVLVGVSFAAMARRLPRAVLLWGSAAGATAGAGLFRRNPHHRTHPARRRSARLRRHDPAHLHPGDLV